MPSINFIGKIIDKSTNEGLPLVTIDINQNGKKTGKGFITNLEGIISETKDLPVGTYQIKISMVGYKPITLTKKFSPNSKELNLGTIGLEEESIELETVNVDATSFNGSIYDKKTKDPISGVKILSDSQKQDKATSQIDGSFSLVIQLDETYLKTSTQPPPQEQSPEEEITQLESEPTGSNNPPPVEEEIKIDTVVIGGIAWATSGFMQTQWEKAGLPTENVTFINYDEKSKFKNLLQNNPITKIIGFSGGGNLIWNEINSSFDFIGLIDPSTPNSPNFPISFPPGLPSNVKMVSNSSNWSANKSNPNQKHLYYNLLDMERNGSSNKVNLKHRVIPFTFFKTYASQLGTPPPPPQPQPTSSQAPPEPEVIEEEPPKNLEYLPITAIASVEGYSQSEPIPLVNQDGSLKTDLGWIFLTPIKSELKEQKIKNKNLTENQKKIIDDFSSKDFISSVLKKIFRTIQDRLIPIILDQIAAFGITKFNNLVLENIQDIPKTCPPNIEELNKLISNKNKLTKQLNNLYKSVNLINKFLDIPPIVIKATEIALIAAEINVNIQASIPSTIATPIPVGPILIVKDLIDQFKDLIGILKQKVGVGTLQLKLIIEELVKVLTLLNVLDALIQSCAEELDEDQSLTQTSISDELLNSTQQQSNQLSPVVTNVNGFEMAVISEDGKTDYDLKRRRAVAKNKAGIIMLKGELSFSSNDQILIDELVFYIQQNDLKAE